MKTATGFVVFRGIPMNVSKISGIYLIYCINNGKAYVGSSKSVARRLTSHRHNLRHNCHGNKHLQNAWNLYGEDNFRMGLLQACHPSALILVEQVWIDIWVGSKQSFNRRLKADSPVGVKWTDEEKAAASARVKANPTFKGRKHTDKAKALLSKSAKERFAEKENTNFYGKKHTDAAKLAISKANSGNKYCLGRPATQKCKDAVAASNKNRPVSDKQRAAAKEMWATRLQDPEVRKRAAESIKRTHSLPDTKAKRENSMRARREATAAGITGPITTSYVKPSTGETITYTFGK